MSLRKTPIQLLMDSLEKEDETRAFFSACEDKFVFEGFEKFLELEKKELMDAQKSGRNYKDEDCNQYYRENFIDLTRNIRIP